MGLGLRQPSPLRFWAWTRRRESQAEGFQSLIPPNSFTLLCACSSCLSWAGRGGSRYVINKGVDRAGAKGSGGPAGRGWCAG